MDATVGSGIGTGSPTSPAVGSRTTLPALVVGRLLELGNEIVTVSDLDGTILAAGGAWYRVMGWRPDELVGTRVRDLVHPDDVDALVAVDTVREMGGGRISIIARTRTADGDHRRLATEGSVDLEQGIIATASRDVTDEQRLVRRLRQRDRFFDLATDGLAVLREHRRAGPHEAGLWIQEANAGFHRLLALPAGSLRGRAVRDLIHPDDLAQAVLLAEELRDRGEVHGELRLCTDDGRSVWFAISARRDLHDDAYHLIGHDITRSQALAERLERTVRTDPVTGLPNRVALSERLEDARHLCGGVVVVDLDHFGDINASGGMALGDEVLSAVARRFTLVFGADGHLARFGADDFAVVVPGARATAIAHRLRASLAEPIVVGHRRLRLTCSIGVAEREQAATAPRELLVDAEEACRTAERAGGDAVVAMDAGIRRRRRDERQLIDELSVALRRDELELHYQAVVDLRSARIVGAEGLVRWNHPERGLLFPGDFIPTAERCGLVVEIGEAVLSMGCRQLALWQEQGRRLRLSLNVSTQQLSPELPVVVERAARLSGARLEDLVLEVTETGVMDDPDKAIGVLSNLRDAGARIAVDDFGTGHSSLAYLDLLPLDLVKIDRTFSARHRDPVPRAIIEAVVLLGRTLGVDVLAEGIETEAQHEDLTALGITLGQGYLFHRPASAAAFDQHLRSQRGTLG